VPWLIIVGLLLGAAVGDAPWPTARPRGGAAAGGSAASPPGQLAAFTGPGADGATATAPSSSRLSRKDVTQAIQKKLGGRPSRRRGRH